MPFVGWRPGPPNCGGSVGGPFSSWSNVNVRLPPAVNRSVAVSKTAVWATMFGWIAQPVVDRAADDRADDAELVLRERRGGVLQGNGKRRRALRGRGQSNERQNETPDTHQQGLLRTAPFVDGARVL